MTRTATDVMETDFFFVDCDATVAEAEEYFRQGGAEALPVLNPDGKIFGLLTARNLLQFYQRPLNNPRAFRVWEICDTRPLTATPDTALDDLLAALRDNPAREMLIVDDEQQLVGVISTDRLLQASALPVGSERRTTGGIRNDRL